MTYTYTLRAYLGAATHEAETFTSHAAALDAAMARMATWLAAGCDGWEIVPPPDGAQRSTYSAGKRG